MNEADVVGAIMASGLGPVARTRALNKNQDPVERANAWVPFRDAPVGVDHDVVATIVARAAAMQAQVTALAGLVDDLSAGLDAVGRPVFLLSDGGLHHANAAGHAVLRRGDPLALGGRKLTAGKLSARLDGLIHDASRRAANRAGGSLALPTETGRPAVATALPVCVGSGEREAAGGGADVMLHLDAGGAISPPVPEVLIGAYRLTPAEARLAIALADGDTLRSAAERFGTTVQTVRSQLAHVFAKIGVSRQSELVRLLLTLGHGLG